MKITRISGHDAYSTKIVMACIVAGLERDGRAVLSSAGNSTTRGILQMCSKPVPFAIVINDYDPAGGINLEELAAEPRMQKVLCFVEQPAAMPDDRLDDVLPLRVPAASVPRLVRASGGIVTPAPIVHDESEGGHHD